jgi:cell wall-associated NlpC family hydrolase
VNLRPARLLPLVVVGAIAPLLVPTPSAGAPIDDLREEANQLTTEIEENGAKVAALGEKLNAAQIRLDEAQAKIDDSQARITASEARIRELRLLIAERAAAAYRTAGTDGPLDVINADNANDAGARSKYTDSAAARDDALVDDLAAAKEDLEHERTVAEQAREVAQGESDALGAAKAEADAAAAEQEELLSQVEGEISGLVAEEQARRAAELAAATPAPAPAPAPGGNGGGGGGGGSQNASPAPSGPPPMGHGGAGAAVAYAQAQVGKPYCYAGTGPGCYDCSGLTMMAWAEGGVSMPHYSGAQGSMFPAVPLSELQPGDLITTSSWSAHVGIWVGGGYVHATHTGDFIKFVGGSGSVVAAVRPG